MEAMARRGWPTWPPPPVRSGGFPLVMRRRRWRCDPGSHRSSRVRVLRGDLDPPSPLLLGPGYRVDQDVDPLLRARSITGFTGPPAPPGRDRPAPRSAGGGRTASPACAPGAARDQPVQRGLGVQRAVEIRDVARPDRSQEASLRPSPSATTASRGRVARCSRRGITGRRRGASAARSQTGFLALERRASSPRVRRGARAVGDEQAAAESVAEEEAARSSAPLDRRPQRRAHAGPGDPPRRTKEAIAGAAGGAHLERSRGTVRGRAGARTTGVGPTSEGDDTGARLEPKAAARLVDEFGVAVTSTSSARPEGARAIRTFFFSTSSTRRGCPRPWATPQGSLCCGGMTGR